MMETFDKKQPTERDAELCGRLMLPQKPRRKLLANLFYEPSTRTRFSFSSAMKALGGDTVETEAAGQFSSVSKGETLPDTIRVVSGYADAIVLRHPQEGAAKEAAGHSSVPVINAGDGGGQHPTQALLDLYTIKKELGRVDNLTVAMVGDLKNGRTVHSLSYLLARMGGIRMIFVAPQQLAMRQDILDNLRQRLRLPPYHRPQGGRARSRRALHDPSPKGAFSKPGGVREGQGRLHTRRWRNRPHEGEVNNHASAAEDKRDSEVR